VEQVEQMRLTRDAQLSLATTRRELPDPLLAPNDPLPSYPLQVSQSTAAPAYSCVVYATQSLTSS
jgi:hypothetical protein